MRLTRKQTICDIPILKIRDYFDHIRPALISPEMISEQFDLNKEKTKELYRCLIIRRIYRSCQEEREVSTDH